MEDVEREGGNPLGAHGEVVTGWSEDWPLSEEVDSPNDSTPCSTGEGWEGRGRRVVIEPLKEV